jgi:cation diffusion facilitator CzcD-associated flavoprotein CzcO
MTDKQLQRTAVIIGTPKNHRVDFLDLTYIGAGVGGVATAARLAKAGFKVTVLEKNDFTGGRCSLIHHNGYVRDTRLHVCSTYLTYYSPNSVSTKGLPFYFSLTFFPKHIPT